MAQASAVTSIGGVLSALEFGQKAQSAGTTCASLSTTRKFSSKVHDSIARFTSKKFKSRDSQLVRCAWRSASVSDSKRSRTELNSWDPDLTYKPSAGPAVEFKLSDFELCSHVSVGLAGKGDEVLFEGVVRNPESPLKGMRVVLRQLASRRAQRWGHRALQVISNLVPQEHMYTSYATRVHGYILPTGGFDQGSTLTLVHGYHGSYSLHQWLHSEDWLSELESRLSLDEEVTRRIGDDRLSGPAAFRHLRLVRILMRDLLIGVNYLHTRGYAHTQLRLQNIQISEADKHVKVGLLGNAAPFPNSRRDSTSVLGSSMFRNADTRQLMIAYDMRCVGFIMAKIMLRELMDPSIFSLLKNFLNQGHDPSGLREYLLPILNKGSSVENIGIQIMDRDGGAGWNLLAHMLASKPTERIGCLDALRHPFLCGPMWRIQPSVEMTRWSAGSTAVRIVEEYIYGPQQRNRLSQLVDIMERMSPNHYVKDWRKLISGRWRLLYNTGKHIGLTRRQGQPAVLIGNVNLNIEMLPDDSLSISAEVDFTVMRLGDWPEDKKGMKGSLKMRAPLGCIYDAQRFYTLEEKIDSSRRQTRVGENSVSTTRRRSRQNLPVVPCPESIPIVRFGCAGELVIDMNLDYNGTDGRLPQMIIREVRHQIPREIFDVTDLVCGTYVDSRLMILRGVTGSACLFARSPRGGHMKLLS